jgi:nucleotide-binding universal stress UspA family protein
VYQKILVPIDGSRSASQALDEAIKIAREQQSTLRILHVVNEGLTLSPDVPSVNLSEVDEGLYAQGKALVTAAESRARDAGVRAEGVVVEEVGHRPGAGIVQQAKEWPADLIVCGTHGRRGIGRLVLGSDAEYIVRRASVPVLLLRNPD